MNNHHHLEILRWRHTDLGPDKPFSEAEVTDGKKKYYVSLSVNLCGEEEVVLEDNHWGYVCPLDEVDFMDDERTQLANDIDFSEVAQFLADLWNRDPVFKKDGWHER